MWISAKKVRYITSNDHVCSLHYQTWGYWFYVEWFENYCHGTAKKQKQYYRPTWVAERDMVDFTGEYVQCLRHVQFIPQQSCALRN